MNLRLLRKHFKNISKAVLKYIQNYVKGIIEEINVKSFKKYKYNFLCEFIGSFIFVFFISIYMLNSNYNEEYVIKNTVEINPYKHNDIFITPDNVFDNEFNNLIYKNDYNQDVNLQSIMLEKNVTDVTDSNPIINENDEKNINLNESLENNVKLNDNINDKNDIHDNKHDIHDNKNDINYNKNDINDNTNDINDNKIYINDNKNKIIEELKEKNENEPVLKNVENIIFKDNINKYSKIKIDDIYNINLDKINEYKTMPSKKNNVGTYVIYTIFGCLIYVLFVILGAHINPTYTYALWFLEPEKYGILLTTFYVFFQYIGGILASILVAHIYGNIFIYSLIPKKKVMKTFLCETVCTFILTLLLINLYKYKKRFLKENKGKKLFNKDNIKSNIFDIYEFDKGEDKKKKLSFYLENNYIKYIMNNIFYLLFIFFSLLFFVFVTNTTLNPMFSTSTLYTYMYFKLFKKPNTLSIYSILVSFLSFKKIFQLIVLYLQSLPFWIGPYIGSTFAAAFISLFKNEDEDIMIIDTNTYKYNKKEKQPLINKIKLKKYENAYLMEYNDNIDLNMNTYTVPVVF